jgi:hypothetical protein
MNRLPRSFTQNMKAKNQLLAAILLAVSSLVPAWAQNFDAGSNGSLGALNVADADVTVDLPPDGRLNYTTVTVAAGRTLRFKRNALNTPVYLLAQGDVVIGGGVTVDGGNAPGSPPIGGAGGPGGFDGGKPGFGAEFPPGDGYGPGGGVAGDSTDSPTGAGPGAHGAVGNGPAPKGVAYGSPLLIPLMGGSGGGGIAGQPGLGGGGGGGAILIASNTKIELSAGAGVVARGGNRTGSGRNGGSGGAIRLLAPKVSGGGTVNALGGNGGGYANNGRIRVDCLDKTALTLDFQPLSFTTVGANLFVAPSVVPRLDLVKAAGRDIPLGTGNTVQVQLPFNSDTNQTVTIRAQDFNADVPIRLTLTPDSGPRIVIDTNIVNTAQNPATLVIPVGLPVNNLITIHAWTR